MNFFILLVVVIVAFISTNLDDLFILMAYFSKKTFSKKEVVVGQYLGLLSLILISSSAYFFQLFLPENLIALLGFIPIAIGVKNIYELFRKDTVQTDIVKSSKDRFNFLQVALVTFTNGGDNIGVYTPLFAGMGALEISWAIVVFMIMTGLWCLISYKMVETQVIGTKLKKYGHIILPFVLIVIGILIIVRGFI